MAWETGTAAGYRDLLAKLKIFTSANGWKVERFVQGSANLADHEQTDELFISSPGKSNQEMIVLGFKTEFSKEGDRYNWKLTTGTRYSPVATYENQPVFSGTEKMQYLYLWQNSITYWFIVNAARVIVVAQISGTTHAIYMGKLQSYCSLGHWPKQVGCYGEGIDSKGRWSSQGDGFSNFMRITSNQAAILWIDGTWVKPDHIFPNQSWSTLVLHGRPTGMQQYWHFPLIVQHWTHGALGEFEGCFFILGHGISAGQEMHVGTTRYLIVQNIYRNFPNTSYMAVELN
ncbi:hypothetical protein [Vibrio cholerae]|uniref:hypothetical protein n=1 Tax=Vibrio cholerae TaxID=666 RepID=UPI003075CD11